FSENQAREELHYIDQADSILGYQKLTGSSERKITAALGISKSEVHRCLKVAKLPTAIKEAAKAHNTEKYVLLEWNELPKGEFKNEVKDKILAGELTKRIQLKRLLASLRGGEAVAKKKVAKKVDPAVDELMKALKVQMKNPKLKAHAQAMLKELMQ